MNGFPIKIEYESTKTSPAPKKEIKKTPENSAFHYANNNQAKNSINHNVNTKVENTNKVESQRQKETLKSQKIEQTKKIENQKDPKIEQSKSKIEEKKEMVFPKPEKVESYNKTKKFEQQKKVETPKPLPKNLESKNPIQQVVSSIPKASSPIKPKINSQINNEQNANTINNPVNGNTGVPPPPPPQFIPKPVLKPPIDMELNLQKQRVDREQESKNVRLKKIVKENNIYNNNNDNGDKKNNFYQ